MSILDRYILKHVLGAIFLVLLVLGGLDLLFAVFDEAGGAVLSYTFTDALTYVLLIFPGHIYELLPMCSLIGALAGLGVLAGSNELVVMQASGVRVLRIVWAVMKPTAVIMILGILLGEFVAPPLHMKAELGKAVAYGQELLVSQGGYWLKDRNRFIHANAIEPGGNVMHQVTFYTYDDHNVPVGNLVADRAEYLGTSGGSNSWRLHGVSALVYSDMGSGLESSLTRTETRELELGLTPELMEVLVMDADNMAITDLYRFASWFDGQGQDASQYFLAFWKKLFQPLTTAALVLVAVSFIFGPLRASTMGSRIFIAICFGMAFMLLQRALNIVSLVYQSEPLVAVLLPILLSAAIGLGLLRRAA